jgi:hypothetical protein
MVTSGKLQAAACHLACELKPINYCLEPATWNL